MNKIFEKDFTYKGYGFVYLKTITDNNEMINGSSFFWDYKPFLTIAFNKNGWKDWYGNFHVFTLGDRSLITKWIVLGLKKL